ncbi:MAG TPA: site-specific DNA-methyltransferase [bacterium]|nr:site-specific DNA-methyltransferase [bacterium]HPP07879.1 site-specific DNA-methyltransferase [bacterium]
MENLLNNLKSLLQKDERLVSEGEILKNKIIELALKLDRDLIKLLLSHEKMKEVFFVEVDGTLIFDKDKFIKFVSNKQFLPDSYTAFKNKIGLIDEKGEFISEKKEVVLSWPYKDCVLEGGMTKEDQKRDEIFWNEILAPDEISRLFDPKVFTNAKRIDAKGEHKFDGFRTDDNGDIKDNLIIKGNNLLALHSLKKRFAGKVKLIYIDPPYNTGKDSFKYNDSFNHSSWLIFMKNRLIVAKDLLSNDGTIWINIDDNEGHYLKILCDEIFGRENFVINFIWQKKYSPANDAKWFSDNHDHILVFAKNKESFKPNLLPRTDEMNNRYFNPDNDPRGPWKPGGFSVKTYKKEYDYPIETPSGKIVYPPKGSCWQTSKENYLKLLKDNRIWFGPNNDAKPQLKQFLSEVQHGVVCKSIWLYDEVGHNQISRKEIVNLFDDFTFSTPKPERLIQRILHLGSNEGDLVLDFFAGSGTTGAVAMKMKRQFILTEQMEYINSVTVARLKKVTSGELGGISKEVGWKGGGDFVYLELMKWNENFADEIKKAKTKEELKKLWDAMKEKAFLSYKVDVKAIDEHAKDFADLSIDDQKRFLLECLDKNHWYVNYSEIDDEEYGVSEEDKKLNREFYED